MTENHDDLIRGTAPRTSITIMFRNNVKIQTETPHSKEELQERTNLTSTEELVKFQTATSPPEFVVARRSDVILVMIQEKVADSRILRARPVVPSDLKI
jgi:hypothetical protein